MLAGRVSIPSSSGHVGRRLLMPRKSSSRTIKSFNPLFIGACWATLAVPTKS